MNVYTPPDHDTTGRFVIELRRAGGAGRDRRPGKKSAGDGGREPLETIPRHPSVNVWPQQSASGQLVFQQQGQFPHIAGRGGL